MRPSPARRDPPDPARRGLQEVRRGLLRLHKALIDSERAVFERRHGPMSSGQLLQALLNEPFFAWLRPYSALVVEMDEALAADEPLTAERSRALVERVLRMIAADPGEEEAPYDAARRRDPAVLFAHVELSRRIADAQQQPPEGDDPNRSTAMTDRTDRTPPQPAPGQPGEEPLQAQPDGPAKRHGDALQQGTGSRHGEPPDEGGADGDA